MNMKRSIIGFVGRGLVACGFGPLVLAIVYLILKHTTGLESISIDETCLGILSMSLLAFIVGGMNVIYHIERLPLMAAILIHGSVLYAVYLATYLLNGWLETGITHILVFTGIFVVGYLIIWAVIYSIFKRNTSIVNARLKEKRNSDNIQ